MKNFKFRSIFFIIASTFLLTGCIGEYIDNSNLKAPEAKILEKSLEDSVKVSIPKDCITWFDGCNTCFVTDGIIGGCTRKFCNTNELENPKCIKTKKIEESLNEENIVFKVGPEKIDCQDVFNHQCLVVNGESFHDDIEGFYFEPGFNYEISIIKSLAFDTSDKKLIPANASKYRYKLVDIISKIQE